MKHKAFILFLISFLVACSGPVESVLEENSPQEPEVVEEPVVIEEPDSYIVTYHLTHTNEIQESVISAGEAVTLTPIPRVGYVFVGWFFDEPLTQPAEAIESLQSDINLYPKWEPIPTFVVRYHLIHEDRVEEVEVLEGRDHTLRDIAQEGFRFLGWFLDPELTKPVERLENVKEDINLYPKWVANTVSLGDGLVTPRSELLSTDLCRIGNVLPGSTVRTGFPMASERLPSTGDINVQVLFIDFPDFEGTRTQSQLDNFFEGYIGGIEGFFEDQSFGRVNFNWVIEPGFVRVDRNFYDLSFTRASQSNDLDYVLRRAVAISDASVEYSEISMVIVFLNPDIPESLADVSPAWPLDRGGAIATDEGNIYNATFIAGDAVRIGYPIIAHEIGHLFGLIDLYDYQWQVDNPENDWLRQFKFTGVFDFMNWATANQFGDNRDMLAWQRYLLDWITDEQVRCVDQSTSSVTTHLLAPSHEDTTEPKMVVVPLSRSRALVVEVKDRNPYCSLCNGGVYTYIVDTSIYNGRGPIRMVRPDHSQMDLFQDAYLSLGQKLIYENITIEYVDDYVYPIVQISVE